MDVWQRAGDFLKGEPKVLEWGTTPLGPLPHADHLKRWIHKGYHGKMKYMEENLELRGDPRRYAPWAKSALLLALAIPRPVNPNHPTAYKVSRYAQGEDYHRWGNRLLSRLAEFLSALHPESRIEAFLDTRPVFERDLASEAGLGWRGKNCCTIHPRHGSNFFVAGLLMDLPAPASKPIQDFCGSCRACLDACPTDAFEAPGVLNSNKCISYWTIENKEDLPEDLSEHFQGWIFGCDICQEVCPWNRRAAKRLSRFAGRRDALLSGDHCGVSGVTGSAKTNPSVQSSRETLPPGILGETISTGVTPSARTPLFDLSGLEWLERLRKGGGFQKHYKHTPLMRAGRKRMLRNLAAAAGAAGDVSVKKRLAEILEEEEDPHVREQIRKAVEEL